MPLALQHSGTPTTDGSSAYRRRTCRCDWQTVITGGLAADSKRQLPSHMHGHSKIRQGQHREDAGEDRPVGRILKLIARENVFFFVLAPTDDSTPSCPSHP
ncbi:hypothetical protein ACJQWK_01867 [Exserohilum turcicum]